MKKKSSLRPKRKNEIRYHSDYVKSLKKKVRHPKYIKTERGNLYEYHSISHSKSVDGIEYLKLRKNPRPGDKRNAYYNPQSELLRFCDNNVFFVKLHYNSQLFIKPKMVC